MSLEVQAIHYRVPGRAPAAWPGSHPSEAVGAGTLFQGVTEFLRGPDVRRFDLRRSVTDPLGRLYVKTFEQRSAVTVVAAMDLSASMHVLPLKLQQASILVQGLAWGARRLGDRIGCVGFDRRLRVDQAVSPGRSVGGVVEWCRRMTLGEWRGIGAEGVLELGGWLPVRECLVVLISDFLWPETLIRRALLELRNHWVVPVVLCHRAETESWPLWGIRRLIDAESGGQRLVWVRSAWRRALSARYRAHRRRLQSLFRSAALSPLWLSEAVDFRAVTHHFETLGP